MNLSFLILVNVFLLLTISLLILYNRDFTGATPIIAPISKSDLQSNQANTTTNTDITPANQESSILIFKYPNATQVNTGSAPMVLESSDDPGVITNWYKEKFKTEGFSTTSFIQTNTSGSILNSLVGADGKRKISVSISKEENQAKSKIILSSLN